MSGKQQPSLPFFFVPFFCFSLSLSLSLSPLFLRNLPSGASAPTRLSGPPSARTRRWHKTHSSRACDPSLVTALVRSPQPRVALFRRPRCACDKPFPCPGTETERQRENKEKGEERERSPDPSEGPFHSPFSFLTAHLRDAASAHGHSYAPASSCRSVRPS